MNTGRRNWTYIAVCVIVRAYMLGALAISFRHIITAADLLALHGWQAWTVPFAVDGFAVLGMIGRSARFAPATQRTGLRLQAGAGLVSLAANIYAGHTLGERLYGALIVSAFIVAEWYAGKLAPAVVQTASTRRSEAAKRAAVTKKANAAAEAERKAAAAERRRQARLTREAERMAAGYVPANAPVSPATV